MKKLFVCLFVCAMLVLNLSNIMTLGLKGIDAVGTNLGFCTVDIVDKGSELIYTVEDLGL